MKTNNLKSKTMLTRGIMLSAFMVVASQANALTTIPLCTAAFNKTLPGGEVITMWGFGDDTTPAGACSASVPGPELAVPAGETELVITVRNTLPESVSVMIPGLATTTAVAPVRNAGNRVTSFTHVTATGATGTYSFKAKAGTYLYQTGTHIAKQLQMGLYGAAVQNNTDVVTGAQATAYPGVAYDHSITMLYSEIDPVLHEAIDPVAAGAQPTYGTTVTSTINYKAKYFLVNGEAYSTATAKLNGGTPGSTTLFRFLNAGLETHVPVINGQIVELVAEYGNPYPYSRKQYSVMLPAGQTRDAVMTAPVASDYVIFDRRLRLTNSNQAGLGGLFSVINVDAANPNSVTNFAANASGANNVSSGGGCSVQQGARFDPLLPLLLLISLGFFLGRTRKD